MEIMNYYNYNIKHLLKTETERDEINLNLYNKINICCYEINTDGVNPFLKYLLAPNLFSKLSFPEIPTMGLPMNFLIESVKHYLYNLFVLKNFALFDEQLIVDGFYEDNNDLYLFLNITDCKIMVNDIYSCSDVWLVLIDEIINLKNVCNIDIDDLPYTFFNNRPEFSVLLNEADEPYETPIVAFVGKSENKLNFTYIFGETTQNQDAIFGPYYYFTNFKNAMIDGSTFNNEIKNNSGIVRFAIFMGTTKYIENSSNDEIDDSEIKQ